MLVRLYIEALLVDQARADQIWDAWHNGVLDTGEAARAWMLVAATRPGTDPAS